MAGSKANGAKAAGEENSLSMEPANGSTLNAAQRKKLKKKQREKAKKAAKASRLVLGGQQHWGWCKTAKNPLQVAHYVVYRATVGQKPLLRATKPRQHPQIR